MLSVYPAFMRPLPRLRFPLVFFIRYIDSGISITDEVIIIPVPIDTVLVLVVPIDSLLLE